MFTVEANANYDLLLAPFAPAPAAVIPVGGYHFNDVLVSYNMGQQRRLSGQDWRAAGRVLRRHDPVAERSRRARYAILKQFSVEPRVSINRVELPDGAFTTRLLGARTDYGFSPADVRQRAAAIQLRGPHLQQQRALPLGVSPGQRVFVVWTDEQDTNPLEPQRGSIALRNRAFVIKMTRLFRF